MNLDELLGYVDHTLLKPSATWEDIKKICSEGIKHKTASVCIPPSFVKRAADFVGGRVKICTVIGFPNGYNTTKIKVAETIDAIENGAEEIDMVINIGEVKAGNYDYVLNEIKEIKSACADKLLKVIIETCMLTEDEKIKLCEVVSKSGADFIKTSTGFGDGGATFEDIELFGKYISNGVKIKAAGGITSLADAERFVELGAERLGTSRIVRIAETMENISED